MKSKKILVYGYFGYENNQLDGQTIKTRSIFNLLDRNVSEIGMTVDYFDTQTFKQSKLNLIKSWFSLFKYDVLFYLPAHNNLKYLFPFIFLICKMKGIDIHYVVVGGWLGDYIKKLPIHRKMLARIRGIYPQTHELSSFLTNSFGFKNVFQLHNFRIYEDVAIHEMSNDDSLKLVYMGRIHPKKGVRTLFILAEQLYREKEMQVHIDLYGQVESVFADEFNELLCVSKGNIKYKGALDPKQIQTTLISYDLFLFPTQFYTEGFPGSILDAYIANVPVIVTNWQYAKEFVNDGVSGLICEFDQPEDFISKTISLIKDRNKLYYMKKLVADEKRKYSPEVAWSTIQSNLFN